MKSGCLFQLAILFVFNASTIIWAGDLEPSGEPKSTMKPLDQVEPRIAITAIPFTISSSGSYYLTSNLNSTGQGITVNVNDVSIDLQGFTIQGADVGTSSGIYMNGRKNIFIHNGTIRDFGIGINDGSSSNLNTHVTGVNVISNSKHGILISGYNTIITDCVVSENGASIGGSSIYGIYTGWNCIVKGNTVYYNGASAGSGSYVYGIYCYSGSIVSGNSVHRNGASAVSGSSVRAICSNSSSSIYGNTVYSNGSANADCVGIEATVSCNIRDNMLSYNSGNGIYAGDNCSLSGNTSNNNSLSGIYAGKNCQIVNCTANKNTQRGIYANDYSSIKDCTATANTTDGIWAMSYCSVTGCNAGYNQKVGIFCWSGKVTGNTVCNNNQINDGTLAGIQIWGASQVEENTCTDNKQKNIWINAVGSTVERNHLRGSAYGIHFASGSNYYAGNRSSGTSGGAWSNAAVNTNGGDNVAF